MDGENKISDGGDSTLIPFLCVPAHVAFIYSEVLGCTHTSMALT